MHKGKLFSEFNDQPDENGAYHLVHSIPSSLDLVRKGLETEGFSEMIRAFREFRSERKKRTTSGSCPQFPKRFSGKLPFHLTSNGKFRIFWLNGKTPISHKIFSQRSKNSVVFCSIISHAVMRIFQSHSFILLMRVSFMVKLQRAKEACFYEK